MFHSDELRDDLEQVVGAIKQGDHIRARQLLDHLLLTYPQNADCWYLESFLTADAAARIQALGRALALNPGHYGAHKRLRSLALLNPGSTSSTAGTDSSTNAPPGDTPSLDDLLHGSGVPGSGNTFILAESPPLERMGRKQKQPDRLENSRRWLVGGLWLAALTLAATTAVLFTRADFSPQPAALPQSITTTPLPTPVAPFQYWDWSQPLVLRGEVNGLPAGTLVWLISQSFTGAGWIYEVRMDGGYGGVLFVPAEYLEYPDVWRMQNATPTAAFQQQIGMGGYPLMLLVPAGTLPAGTRVRISSGWHNGAVWFYEVVAQDEVTVVQVAEYDLTYALDVTPGPTLTPSPAPYPLSTSTG